MINITIQVEAGLFKARICRETIASISQCRKGAPVSLEIFFGSKRNGFCFPSQFRMKTKMSDTPCDATVKRPISSTPFFPELSVFF